ncbi:MAG TPA: hypothetical protein PLK34_02880, partial [Candidatus Pacearchaeota archaeon]|nr:hypothetical protein [Candidatus Pacearchaeota archaeon]
MKKKVLLSILFTFVILTFYLVSAADSPTNLSDYAKKLSNAKSCVTEKTKDCSTISLEEKIFAYLSNGACKTSLLEDSSNSGECWP